MTPIDQALAAFYADPENTDARNDFYRLFLNTDFYLPTYDEATGGVAVGEGGDQALPLIMEADGNDYMMIFDSQERVVEWSEEGVICLTLPGSVLVEMATEGLHLAMNVGTEHNKQFVPEEIAWLKQVVVKSMAEDEEVDAE